MFVFMNLPQDKNRKENECDTGGAFIFAFCIQQLNKSWEDSTSSEGGQGYGVRLHFS